MLDSLVRVSRRVGWETDRFATDPMSETRERPNPRDAGGRRALRAVLNSRTHAPSQASPAKADHEQKSSVTRPANASQGYNTRANEGTSYLPRGLLTAQQPVVALSPRKVHRPKQRKRTQQADLPKETSQARAPPLRQAEFRGSTMRSHPFASIRFHVLLNSLFKVLFNFPSRYLSAIGLVPVFSLRWSLPPTLGCIHKQPDS